MVAATAKKRSRAASGEEYVTIASFARQFKLSVAGVHKLIHAGKIDAIELPSTGEKVQRRIPQSEVDRIARQKVKPTSVPNESRRKRRLRKPVT